MDHLPTHPFPYFGLLVTRDAAAIKAAVEAKYVKVAPLKNNPTRLHEFKAFMKHFELIAVPAPVGLGKYDTDLGKVEAIVKKCLPLIEEYVLGLVSPHANTLHPKQVEKSIEMGEKSFGVASSVSKPHIEQLLKSRNITISVDKPPPGPIKLPKPVTAVTAECGDASVRLAWELPKDDCERVKIVRCEGATPRPSDRGDEVAGKQHLDANVEPGREYTYGLFSMLGSESLMCEVIRVRARGSVKDLKAVSGGGKALLNWTLPPNTESVRVLRSKTAMSALVDDRARPLLPPGAQEVAELGREEKFEDSTTVPGSTYYYAVLARHGMDWYSPSECKSVTITKAPPSPQEFKAEAKGVGPIYVSWKPISDFAEATYTLSRSEETPGKPRTPPRVIRDNAKHTTYDDESVVAGSTYRYLVVTNANGMKSEPPSVSDAVTATGEVENLRIAAQAGRVELSWTKPAGASRVEIRRNNNTVPHPATVPGVAAQGVDLFSPPGASMSFVDTKVMNRQAYGYRVSCVFLGADGKEILTRGLTDTVTPREPPPLVRDLKLLPDVGGAVRLSWANPGGATVRVIRAATVPTHRIGDQLTPTDAGALGKALDRVGHLDVLDTTPDPSRGVYLVFSEDGHAAIYCGLARFVELTACKAVQKSDVVHVQWDWPDASVGVQLTRTSAGGTKQQEVQRPLGHKGTGVNFKIASIGPGEHEFTLRCLTDPLDRASLAGHGTKLKVKIVSQEKITWKFERQSLGWGKTKVELVVHGEHSLRRIEKLVLVGKVNRVPTSIDDGRFHTEWEPPVTDLDGVLRCPVPAWSSRDGKVFCRLFALPAEEAAIAQPKETDAVL